MTFEEFISNDIFTNYWIEEDGIRLYVRKPHKYSPFYDLANMSADEKGRGALTKFLNKYETNYSFRVENIHNERLIPFLQKRGYEMQDGYSITMIKNATIAQSGRAVG